MKVSQRFIIRAALIASVLSTAAACSTGKDIAAVGTVLPNVSAPDQQGIVRNLSEFRGKFVVVYFYPRDFTPGCTKEACAFRDIWNRYVEADVLVIGVSTDDQASKEKFAKEHRLPFPLIADTQKTWVEAFKVPTRLGAAARVTFILNPEGKIVKTYPEVDPGLHALQVLKDIETLRKAM